MCLDQRAKYATGNYPGNIVTFSYKGLEFDWKPLETQFGVSGTDKFRSMSLQINNQTHKLYLDMSLSAQELKNSHSGKIPEKQQHGSYELRVLIPIMHATVCNTANVGFIHLALLLCILV